MSWQKKVVIGITALLLFSACANPLPKLAVPIPPCKPSSEDSELQVARANWAKEHPKVTAKVVSVVSTEALKVVFADDEDGNTYLVHYRGVRGPDPSHYFYQAALEANRRLVEGETVELVECAEEAYRANMLSADIYSKGEHLNSKLISEGYSWASPFANDEELAAKAQGLGLWEAWCADKSRFKVSYRVVLSQARGGPVFNLFNPAGERMIDRIEPPFQYSYTLHALLREHQRAESYNPLDFYYEIFSVRSWSNLVNEAEFSELKKVMHSQSCGAVFLNAPQNAEYQNFVSKGFVPGPSPF